MPASKRFHPSHRGATPSIAEKMRARAKAVEATGKKVIYLQVGQPSTGAPEGTIDAIHQASDTSILGYTSAAGIPELRQRISKNKPALAIFVFAYAHFLT